MALGVVQEVEAALGRASVTTDPAVEWTSKTFSCPQQNTLFPNTTGQRGKSSNSFPSLQPWNPTILQAKSCRTPIATAITIENCIRC